MTLSSILNNATSGLQVAQAGLRVVSDNVANVGTAGYVRKVLDQVSVSTGGVGDGVAVAGIQTTADQFLEATSRAATSTQGAADIQSSLLDQAQALFGDPSGSTTGDASTTFTSSLNDVFAGFISLAGSPTSATRTQAVSQTQAFFDQADQLSSGLGALAQQADSQLTTDVGSINGLLTQIDSLNVQISRASVGGGDASGLQDQQSQALDSLSALIGISTSRRPTGGVVVRAGDGALLVGGVAPATLSYDSSTIPAGLVIGSSNGTIQALDRPGSGEVQGLLTLRNTQLPGIQSQVAELVSQTAAQLNAVHNAYSAVPPPATLVGRDTGTDEATALAGFTGKTTVAITDATGVAQASAAIDFGAGTITGPGGTLAFVAGNFDTQLTTALAGAGTASFSGGALTIGATSPAKGVVVSDDTTAPSSKAGQGFSAFLGLNDLVSSSTITNYATGIAPTTANGLSGQIDLSISAADGSPLGKVSVVTSAAGTVGALLTQLNATSGGVGLYGAFALDASGRLSFTPKGSASGAQIAVTNDTTAWGAGGASFSSLFGVGSAPRSARLGSFQVRSDIAANPTRLASAVYNVLGTPPLSTADATGADALSQAANAPLNFTAAGVSTATVTTISNYAASLSASLSQQANTAAKASTTADAVKTEANSRRSSTEGVSLDQELVNLTTYQQAYSASARLIQATSQLFSTLLQIVS